MVETFAVVGLFDEIAPMLNARFGGLVDEISPQIFANPAMDDAQERRFVEELKS